MNIGIDNNKLEKSVTILSRYLADTYFLYFKTHTFHWNVVGPQFYSLHKLFEDQYSSLFESIDEIAERIRSLGSLVPASFSRFQELSCLKEASEKYNAQEMLTALVKDNEQIVCNLRSWIVELGELNDVASEDFLTGRLAEHEKMAWMLGSHLL